MRTIVLQILTVFLLCTGCLDDEISFQNNKTSVDNCSTNEVIISVTNQSNKEWMINASYFGCNLHLTSIDFSVDVDSTMTKTISESINERSSNILRINLLNSDGSSASVASKRVSQPMELKLRITSGKIIEFY